MNHLNFDRGAAANHLIASAQTLLSEVPGLSPRGGSAVLGAADSLLRLALVTKMGLNKFPHVHTTE